MASERPPVGLGRRLRRLLRGARTRILAAFAQAEQTDFVQTGDLDLDALTEELMAKARRWRRATGSWRASASAG